MQKDAVQAALYALADRSNGRLTPEAVVNAARSPDSPLHPHFTWADDEAAAKHRLNEARALIRSVRVDVVTEHFSIKAPGFVRDPTVAPSSGYISIGKLRTDEDAAREAVIAEFSRASAALARAKAVALSLGLAEQIDEINGQIIALSERASEAGASAPN